MKNVKKNNQVLTEQQFKNRLKVVFRNYTGPTQKFINEINSLGFSIVRNRKHLILKIVMENHEFSFAVSCTPSDYRGNMNVYSCIYRKLFRNKYEEVING